MSRQRSHLRIGLITLLLAADFATGCNNIWEWTVDDGSFEALMAEGRHAIQNLEYARAEEAFSEAVQIRPKNSEARYYFAKAAVLNSGVDVFSLVQDLTREGNQESGTERIFGFEIDQANSVYRVNGIVLDNLLAIHEGTAAEGAFAAKNVELDIAVAYVLRGILRLRDTNGDGIIDENDASLDDFGILDEEGGFSLDGLDDIPPQDVNDMIDDLNDLLDGGGDFLDELLGDDGPVDTDELNDLIDSMGEDLSAFYVNTGVPGNPGWGDNDGDSYFDGVQWVNIDEECLNGIDDDGDGLVDEDSRIFDCP